MRLEKADAFREDFALQALWYMPDVFTKAKRSQVMSRIRGRGNKETEFALAKLLRAARITGWRRQQIIRFNFQRPTSNSQRSKLSVGRWKFSFAVRPDFIFSKESTAVFVDGCFWHGCPKHAPMLANNRAFWLKKLTGNKGRDRLVTLALRQSGWRVLRIWGHELTPKKQPRWVERIRRLLEG